MQDDDGSAAAGRPRERVLADAFLVLVDTLDDDYDLVDLTDRLLRCCVQLLSASGVAVVLLDPEGGPPVLACSSEAIRQLALLQIGSGEGPCLECVRTGTTVTSADIEADRDRWPPFAKAAAAAGFASVTSMPLRLREQTLGVLTLFREDPGAPDPDDLYLGHALARAIAIGVLHRRSADRTAMLTQQLQCALKSRVVIEQAKGILAHRHGVDMATAFGLLRRHSRNHNIKLADLAAAIAEGSLNPESIGTWPPPGRRTAPSDRN